MLLVMDGSSDTTISGAAFDQHVREISRKNMTKKNGSHVYDYFLNPDTSNFTNNTTHVV